MSDISEDPTPPSDPEDFAAVERAAARERIDQISTLFAEMTTLLAQSMASEGEVTKATSQKMLAKLGELQTAHLMVLKAEEVFHDKFDQETAGAGVDYDIIRHEIGCALDRIRAADATGDVSEGSDG